MKQKDVALTDFAFEGFTQNIFQFLENEVAMGVHPSYAVVKVKEPGGVPEFGPEEGRNNFMEELKDGYFLFFPFSSSNVGDPIPCADGKERKIDEDSDFTLGDIDCVGYLIQLREGNLYINSAAHAGGGCPGPAPSVDLTECDVFEEGMEAYIEQFVDT